MTDTRIRIKHDILSLVKELTLPRVHIDNNIQNRLSQSPPHNFSRCGPGRSSFAAILRHAIEFPAVPTKSTRFSCLRHFEARSRLRRSVSFFFVEARLSVFEARSRLRRSVLKKNSSESTCGKSTSRRARTPIGIKHDILSRMKELCLPRLDDAQVLTFPLEFVEPRKPGARKLAGFRAPAFAISFQRLDEFKRKNRNRDCS